MRRRGSRLKRKGNAFISDWDSRNTIGSVSASNQIRLPLQVSGTYSFDVDWGDGTTNTITSYNQSEILHTYSVGGLYSITITGVCTGWSFGSSTSGGDANKFLSVQKWGSLKLTSTGGYFKFCRNLDLSTVTDVLDLNGTTSLTDLFLGCTLLTSVNRINEWNVSTSTSCLRTFQDCTNFNSDISGWNVANVSNFTSFLYKALNFNSDLSIWNVSSATNMQNMFFDCFLLQSSFTNWNVANVSNFIRTFRGCQNINAASVSGWNVSNATNIDGFFENLTPTHHPSSVLDAIYNGWAQLTLKPNVTAKFGTLKYTSASSSNRAILTGSPNNWIITDGGII